MISAAAVLSTATRPLAAQYGPTGEIPGTDKRTVEKPVVEKPAGDKPAREKSKPTKPMPENRGVDKPAPDKKKTAADPSSMDKILNRPARHHAFVFSWGAVYENLARELNGRGKLLHLKPGDRIIKAKGGARYEYSFFRKSRVREKTAERVFRDGKAKTVLKRLVLEPAEEPGAARLFAVMVHFSMPMPFHGEYKKTFMDSLHLFYGKAVNVHRHYFDMENMGTQVRVHLRRHRGKAYVLRLVFSSKSIAAERNAHILELRRRALGEIAAGTAGRKKSPVMTSESPRTTGTKFVPGDKVLAETRPSRVYKLNARNTPGMTPGSAARARKKNERLIVDAKPADENKKSVPPGRRP